MRAMSLAIDETEGEQNEMRILNEKLESSTKLIHTLSLQLAELKEQVRMPIKPRNELLCEQNDGIITSAPSFSKRFHRVTVPHTDVKFLVLHWKRISGAGFIKVGHTPGAFTLVVHSTSGVISFNVRWMYAQRWSGLQQLVVNALE